MQCGKAMRHFKSYKGFTLIELMVVLSIVALLLTLAVPRYFNSVEKAKEATLRQDLRVMREAIDRRHHLIGIAPGAKLDEERRDLRRRRGERRRPEVGLLPHEGDSHRCGRGRGEVGADAQAAAERKAG